MKRWSFSNPGDRSETGSALIALRGLAIILALGVAAVVGGCGPKRDDAHLIRLMMWNMQGTDNGIAAAAKAFEREHKGYRVRIEKTPIKGYEEKLIVLMGARDAPDVAILPEFRYPEYVRQHALSDLSLRIPGSKVSRGVPAKDLERLKVSGHIRAVPSGLKGVVWFIPVSSGNKPLAWELIGDLVEKGYVSFGRLKVGDIIRMI